MEEDLTIPQDSAKNCNKSVIDDEREKVKDFVYRHFREVNDGPLLVDHANSTKKEKQTLNKAHCKIQQGAVFSGKILSFGCSVCKDDSTYSPNDLLKHFRAAHKGTLPTYPCDLCGFVTNEFPVLQRHRIEHRNTLVTCELCNDDAQYSLLLLTRHYILCHSVNGQFDCDWCEFTTVDAGTFVQHIHHHNESPWKCSKCKHISLNEEDHQKHMKAHSGLFPYTCQDCGYGSARSEYLKKHVAAVHKEKSERKNAFKAVEDSGTPVHSSASLKLLLKKSPGESQEPQRISKLNSLSGGLPNQNGRLFKSDVPSEEIHQLLDGTGAKKDNKNSNKGAHSIEQSTLEMLQECDSSANSEAAAHTTPNGLKVLMVKNKISLPPNCTTKVMGFKMVDGKKHLVLKVIPATKQDSSPQNHSLVEDVGSSSSEKSKDTIDNGECSNGRGSLHCFAVSPRGGSCIPTDQDEILAVKVKVEEEETAVCSFDLSPHEGDVREPTSPLLNRSSACADTVYPMTNEFDQDINTCHQIQSRKTSDNSVPSTCKATDLALQSKAAQETVSETDIENCGAADGMSLSETVANSSLMNKHRGKSSCNTTPEKTERESRHKNNHNLKTLLTNPVSLSESSSENCTQNSPNQEVFTFHNYSKEILSTSPNTSQAFDNMSDLSADKESIYESSQFSLTLAESPEPYSYSCNGEETSPNVSRCGHDGDVEVDECIANIDDPPTEDENPESVLQDFNIIKIEEESIPISKTPAENKGSSASLGSFVEEHSETIISQQLTKEKLATSSASSDSSKQTKTTVRILQLPEGKQPVLLRTAENRFAMPVQVKASPGFKLITNSVNPQINVSYMKPAQERSSNPTGVVLTQNRRVGVSAPKAGIPEKGATILSAVPQGVSTSSNRYLINSTGFKGPVLLSSTPNSTPTDKTAKAQPTCYLVQRSVPFVQAPSAPGLRLASTQLPLNSRPVLAMPVGSTEKPNPLQSGRQAFLLRYISPPKSGILLNNQEAKTVAQSSQSNETTGNKVIFKIVTPTGGLLSSGAPVASNQPLFLATRPQTQCFLVSPNKTNANISSSIKKFIKIAQKDVTESSRSPMNVKVQSCEAEKPILAPRPIRPPSQRKRRRKQLFDELPPPVHKARRLSNRVLTEKESVVLWKPVAKDVERTLRLSPFSSLQQIKCPRRYQPVVVLNHPDADIPEVANIMKAVNRYRGAVSKVSLSEKTVQALSELGALGTNSPTKGAVSESDDPRPRPVQSSVRERFLLKLKLRKKSRKKYEVVKTLAGSRQESVMFDCWFCGRLFNSQEDWIGHGQRHLMEATRDWNKLI
ncbi:zinc finger protein 518A-like [Sphaeramia orbicularis]|uniref:Zinc finger protein 518A-like n=1 Tax=Sphaeramia orbicularis TaxID=375764 RepID=A0A673AG19_9TELE|nr:zinc finger protein 518A-like [Sphaeramia orbicularis]